MQSTSAGQSGAGGGSLGSSIVGDGSGSGSAARNGSLSHERGCCGGACGGGKCTTAKVKNCMKVFFAQLFSHVGLCALVVGYTIMGAFIFGYLEKDNELQTRTQVGNVRKEVLDELYNITGMKIEIER